MIDPALAPEEYGYLTTTGRTSGLPREIEIWFALEAGTISMAAGERERSHWVRNLIAEPRVSVRIAGETVEGTARVLEAGTAQDGWTCCYPTQKDPPATKSRSGCDGRVPHHPDDRVLEP